MECGGKGMGRRKTKTREIKREKKFLKSWDTE